MKQRKLTILILMLTIVLWAARPVVLADGIDWLTPNPEQPEQGEELSPAPEVESQAQEEEPKEMTPAGVSTPDETEWLTPDEAPPSEADEEPEINVTVPASGELLINPYRHPVDLNGQTVYDQIVNGGQILTSHSTVPITVSASLAVNTEESGGITITPHPIAEGEPEKLAYLYVEFQNLPDSETAAKWNDSYTGASSQLLATDGAASSGEVLQIAAGNEAPSYAAYRLFGQLSENPETGWQSGDKLSVTVSFTFRPIERVEPSPTQTDPEAELEAVTEPQPEVEEVPDRNLEVIAIPTSDPILDYNLDYDPEPEQGQTYEEAVEPEDEKIESFASGSNPDWMLPPDENRKEQ